MLTNTAAELELGAKEVFATAEDFVNEAQERHPLVIEAANSPFGFRDAVHLSRMGCRVVLAGITDGDGYMLPAPDARRGGLKVKFVRRTDDDFPRVIDRGSSGRVERESYCDAP